MRVLISGLVLSTALVAAGCGGEDGSRNALREQELERQLALALAAHEEAQSRLAEIHDGPPVEPEPVATSAYTAPRTSAPARQTTAARQPTARTVRTAPAPQPQPRVVTKTNSRRDAAIGAGVGAVAGAVIHKPNRVKGAVVGAAVGGVAGAIVGATIDKKTTVVYD